MLLLVLVFGTVFSSSHGVFAVDMGDTMDGGGDDGNNMPPPEDAPATTDTLTTGGGSDNDEDDDDNDDDSGGSGDDKNDNDKDKDNDKDNEPTSEDAPVTTDALTAKKIECPAGQEYYLFSMSCAPVGPDGTTSPATVCPTTYNIPDKLSVANAVWEFTNNHEIKPQQHDTQQTLLHRVATPERPGATLDPRIAAICTGQPISITNADGTTAHHQPDGTKFIAKSDGSVDKYNADNKLTSTDKLDPDGNNVQSIEFLPGTGKRTSETTFNPVDGRPVTKVEYNPGSGKPTRATEYYIGSTQPHRVGVTDPNSGLPFVTEYHPDGKKHFVYSYQMIQGKEFPMSIEYTPDGGRIEKDGYNDLLTTYDKGGKKVSVENDPNAIDEEYSNYLRKQTLGDIPKKSK